MYCQANLVSGDEDFTEEDAGNSRNLDASDKSRNKGQSAGRKGNLDNNSTSNSQKGGKSVKRALAFDEVTIWNGELLSCTSLLSAMELEDSDAEDTELLEDQISARGDDDEMSNLPNEWIQDMVSQKEEHGFEGDVNNLLSANVETSKKVVTEEDGNQCTQPSREEIEKMGDQQGVVKARRTRTQVWGLIPAKRKSQRIQDDGKTMM